MIFKQTEKFKLKAIFKPINRIYLFPVFVCLVLLFCPLIVIALDTWNTGYGVYSGTNKNVIVGSSAGPCYKITNSDSSKDYFIPTKTIAEWNAFTAHKPANITISACNVPVCKYIINDYVDETCESGEYYWETVNIQWRGITYAVICWNGVEIPGEYDFDDLIFGEYSRSTLMHSETVPVGGGDYEYYKYYTVCH